MAGLVLELQADAMNAAVRTSDLLRKARAVSVKLGATDIQSWIDSELGGYRNPKDVPEYRGINGHPRCYNPYRGWMPLMIQDPNMRELISSFHVTQPISEIEELTSDRKGSLIRTFAPNQAAMIMEKMDEPFEPGLEISKSAFVAILDAVRTQVLNWALALEARGVLGTGMSFSKEERERATHVTNNYTTNIGSVSGHAQVQQGSSDSTQTVGIDTTALRSLIDELSSYSAKQLGLSRERYAELSADLDTLRSQVASTKPKAGIIREGLSSVRHILESAAGHALVTHGPAIMTILNSIPR